MIAFDRIRLIEDAEEKLKAARQLGNRYYPNHEESLQAELKKGLDRMVMIRLDIEHLTGKESIELTRMRHSEGQ